MVATFFLDWAFSFAAGLLFGIVGARADTDPARALRLGLVFVVAGILAPSLVLYALVPDWMWMYWVDASALPVAVVALGFAMYLPPVVTGVMLARALPRTAAIGATVATGAAIVAAEAATRVRLFHFGSRAEFLAGRAPLGVHDGTVEPAMWVVLVAGSLSLVLLVWLLRRVARPRPAAIL